MSDDFLKEHLASYLSMGSRLDLSRVAKLNGWNLLILQIMTARQYLNQFAKPLADAADATDQFRQNTYVCAFQTLYGKCFNSSNDRTVTLDATDDFIQVRSGKGSVWLGTR